MALCVSVVNMLNLNTRNVGIVLLCVLPWGTSNIFAGPDEAATLRDWAAVFTATEGVDVQWRYDMVTAPGIAAPPPFRERLVCCWESGMLIESGGGIRRRPGDGKGMAEFEYPAQVTVVTPLQPRMTVRWTPGKLVSPALERVPVELADDRVMRLCLNEYLAAHYIILDVPAAVLESAAWARTNGRRYLMLSTDKYDFAWEYDREMVLQLISIASKTQNGDILFRQELGAHIFEPTLGGNIASERRTYAPASDDKSRYEHVNTAVIESIAYLAQVPEGFTKLDTSLARTVDLATGIVYDDSGKEIGKIISPASKAPVFSWLTMGGILGSGVVVGGAMWWWMQRRAG